MCKTISRGAASKVVSSEGVGSKPAPFPRDAQSRAGSKPALTVGRVVCMPSAPRGRAIATTRRAHRNVLWPSVDQWLWHRTTNKGFATIPKTMPHILQIMDDLSNGKPLSTTYLGLWCETWDDFMANLSKQQEMAHAAGFTGQRAIYTWAGRIQLLHDLGFIDIKPGKSGLMSHALIWNPHRVIRWHHERKTPGLTEGNFNALLERAVEVGAADMLEEISPVSPPPPFARP